MNKKLARSSSLFLLELTVAILFFSLCTGYCAKMFAQSHQICTHSEALAQSVRHASGVAELLHSLSGSALSEADCLNALESQYPLGSPSETAFYEIYFSDQWELCGAASSCYTMEVRLLPEKGALLPFSLHISDEKEELYALETSICLSGAGQKTNSEREGGQGS